MTDDPDHAAAVRWFRQYKLKCRLCGDQELGLTRTPASQCLGSGCMAWRWVGEGRFQYRPDESGNFSFVEQPRQTNQGYCGKAGKP